MCPCPFCTTVAILLCPLLLFKCTREWLKAKLNIHHRGCERCQQAEHAQHMRDHTPCHCAACEAAPVAVKPAKRRGRQKKTAHVVEKTVKRPGRPKKQLKRPGRPAKKVLQQRGKPAKRRGHPKKSK